MKKLSALIISLLIATMGFAQTQQGYVKTKGRMVDGKLVPGQGLKGATVSVHGRTTVLVNADDGAFSFPVSGAQFRLDSVRKKGYQLVDMDAIGKTYEHSSNPLYLVMETPERQWEDQLAAERKIRRTLTNQLHQREDEIEALKTQQKLSDEEYRQALQKLYEDVDQNEQLVKDMVERYSKIDYDQLDEFYRQVSYYIENGELVRADSMLRTRGNLPAQVDLILQRGQALHEEREQLHMAEAVQQADIEEAAHRCYSYFETFKMLHENDSAAYYIELRARLDTTNLQWQVELANYVSDYLSDFETALELYNRILNQSILQYGDTNLWEATCFNRMGMVYDEIDDFSRAIELYNKALFVFKTIFGEINVDVAVMYNNIGLLLFNQGEYEQALSYYDRAMSIMEQIPEIEKDNIAATFIGYGALYLEIGDYAKALEQFEKALSCLRSVYDENHPLFVVCLGYIGGYYSSIGENETALYYQQQALMYARKQYGEMHPDVARCYNSIGTIYVKEEDYTKAIEYLLKSLSIRQTIYGESHSSVATSYNNLGVVCIRLGNYDKALEYFNKVLSIRKHVYGDTHLSLSGVYNNIGIVLSKKGEYQEALEYYQLSIDIHVRNNNQNHVDVARTYHSMGIVYEGLALYNKALECFERAFEIRLAALGEDHAKTKQTRDKISEIEAKLKEQETPSNE